MDSRPLNQYYINKWMILIFKKYSKNRSNNWSDIRVKNIKDMENKHTGKGKREGEA